MGPAKIVSVLLNRSAPDLVIREPCPYGIPQKLQPDLYKFPLGLYICVMAALMTTAVAFEISRTRSRWQGNFGFHVTHSRLCKTHSKQIELTSSGDYEFVPRIYTEIRCHSGIQSPNVDIFVDANNGLCSSLRLHCVQQYRIMHIMQRRIADPRICWEPATLEIKVPYGCECMAPHKEPNRAPPLEEYIESV